LVIAFAVDVELAAVAWARNDAKLLLPRGHTPEVRADGLQREKAFLAVNDVDTRIYILSDGIERVAFGLAGVDHRRRFIQDVGRQVLIAEGRRSGRRNTQRT